MNYIKLKKENEEYTISKVVQVIKNGGVVIIPTDTVYGIAADCKNYKAVKKIYELKKRDYSKPCNILVENIEMIRDVTKGVSNKEEDIIKKFFPRSIDDNI